MFRALGTPNYRIYLAGAFVSNIGTWLQRVAQDWLVLELTHSGTAIGITTGLQLLPALLFGPLAGVTADRFNKHHVLRVTQVAMALPAFLLGFLAITGTVAPWHVYILAFVFGIGTAFDAPVRHSFVVELVGTDDLANAVGLNSASFNTARMIGPAVAGVLIAALGSGPVATGWVIVLNAASYLAVLASLSLLDAQKLRPPAPANSGRGAVREGLRYLRTRPDLQLILATVFFVSTFGMNFQMTSALMATETYGKGAGEYGLLGSIMAIGSVAGALLAARRAKPRLRLVVGSALAFGVVEIFAGLMPDYLTFAVTLPALGFMALTMMTAANASIQMYSAPHMRGRVAAIYLMVAMGGKPLGSPFIGWIGSVMGARWTYVMGGGISLIGVAAATLLFVRFIKAHGNGDLTAQVRSRLAALRRERLDHDRPGTPLADRPREDAPPKTPH